MMKSIATVALKGALPEKLKAISQAGYTGVEIFDPDLVVCGESVATIASMLRDLGLTCVCFQPFRDFEGLAGAERALAFKRAERKFDVMKTLGADLMLVCSSVSPRATGDLNQIAGDFSELGDLAAKAGVRVGYEALAWGRHVHDHRVAWDIVQRADHPNIGIILDSFHSLSRRIPIDSLASIDGRKIFLLQIADAPEIGMDVLYWSRHFRCFPGQGDFAVTDYVEAILAQGYDGPLSLEIFNDRFRAWSANQIAHDGFRSLMMLEDQLAERARTTAAVQKLPQRLSPDRVTFIEFAAFGEEALELKTLLSSLGFSLSGKHRTKVVERWSQGDINIVLNMEPGGFAHSHAVTHGASVCAFGLGVSDPPEVMRRAEALGAEAFSQAASPGELEVPAIRGVGGSLIWFTPPGPGQSFWDTDFERVAHDLVNDGALIEVDHLAQSMPAEEFLSWQLYYTSLLDMARTPTLDIPDPSGLVQSQAIEASSGNVRITLNGAGGQTLASRFVQNYFGAGVQHIAFSTENIFETARRLKAGGVRLLELPRNYYDDLKARFDLSDADIARLSADNILYDRDDDGDYFQLYARAFHKRFFFEFVQRDGYRGYGAGNAGVRLAAQDRAGSDPTAAF